MSTSCQTVASANSLQPVSPFDLQQAYTLLSDGPTFQAKEAARLHALHSLCILDTSPEPEFDDLVHLAAAICGTPIGMLSFVDERRQWFKSCVGLDIAETPRNVAFCHHAIQQTDLMLIEDATLDPRFADSSLVTAEDGLRFYAGMPLETSEGHTLGTLCVFDRVPRVLTAEQQAALRILASQINVRLELRAKHRAFEEAIHDAQAAKLRAQMLEQRFQTFMDSGPFLAFIKDIDGRFIYYNETMAKQFGVSREALLYRTVEDLWPGDLAATYRMNDLSAMRTGQLQVSLEETANPNGSTSVWRSYKFPYTDPEGHTLLGAVCVEVTKELHRQNELQRYQTELEAANQRLRELASVDALTGLSNRRVFDDQLRIAFRAARKSATPLSVLMLDVDHFKVHNDRFGHPHGDDVLRILASCLKSNIRSGDLIARYGGEEFVLLLPDTNAIEARVLSERLLNAVRRTPWSLAPVTVSIGLSTMNPATRDTQHLLGRADEALYAAKCSGRDRVVSSTHELNPFEMIKAG